MIFFGHASIWCIDIHVSPHSEFPSYFPPHPIPLGCHKPPTLVALLHALNSHWSSILHMVLYMFQCCSPKSFHPHLLQLSSKVCSLCLYLLYCPACRIVCTIFLNSMLLLSCFSHVCHPIDGSPPGSPIPGILQARTLEWVAFSFSNAWKWKVKVKSLNHARL